MKHLITLMIISCSFIGLSQYTIYTKGYVNSYELIDHDLETVFTITHDYGLIQIKNINYDVTLEIVKLQVDDNGVIKLSCKDSLNEYCLTTINPDDKTVFMEFPNDEGTEIVSSQLFIITYVKTN